MTTELIRPLLTPDQLRAIIRAAVNVREFGNYPISEQDEERVRAVLEPILAASTAAAGAPLEWQCPSGVLHLYEVVIDDHCVAEIKRLSDRPDRNIGDLILFASDYRFRDGNVLTGFAPRPGELLRVACAKCGREAIVGIGWNPVS